MRLKTAILLALLLFLTSCARTLVINPIEGNDIVRLKKEISYTPEKDGYFFSDYYVEKIIKVKIK